MSAAALIGLVKSWRLCWLFLNADLTGRKYYTRMETLSQTIFCPRSSRSVLKKLCLSIFQRSI